MRSDPSSRNTNIKLISNNYTSEFTQFFLKELSYIYWLEINFREAMAMMQYAASSPQLQNAIRMNSIETAEHVAKLESCFDLLDKFQLSEKYKAILQLMRVVKLSVNRTIDGSMIREIALITGMQKILCYEISAYRSLYTSAQKIQNRQWAWTLNEILEEKKASDTLLSAIALSGIYERAIEE